MLNDPKVNKGHCDLFSRFSEFCLISPRQCDVCAYYVLITSAHCTIFGPKVTYGHFII